MTSPTPQWQLRQIVKTLERLASELVEQHYADAIQSHVGGLAKLAEEITPAMRPDMLTPAQARVLSFIRQCIALHGNAPTRKEIGAEFGFASPNAARRKKMTSPSDTVKLDRVWIWFDESNQSKMSFVKPLPRHSAVEYMRVLSREEVEKLAGGEGVDTQQYINSLLRTIEGQRRHIRELQSRLPKENEPPSFSPNFDERNGIR